MISFQNVTKYYDDQPVLNSIDLSVSKRGDGLSHRPYRCREIDAP